MDPARRLWPPADLRVGDTDRQAVVAELQRHYVEGRLTSEELSERVTEALRARTFGELAALLNDLPALAREVPPEAAQDDWKAWLLSPPLGAALILIGVLAMLWIFVAASGGRWGFFPFWPMLIWGFFFFGRPFGGGRRRF
jgi:Domain of unknown function (DUF1707)